MLALGSTLAACSRNSATTEADSATLAPATIVLQPIEYPLAFDAAREVLRDMGFMLDRVDAQAGVITTQPKGSAGFATPWDRAQSTAGQEVEDFIERNRRVVRIDAGPSDQTQAEGDDLRRVTTPITMRVSVEVARMHTSGRRINTLSVTDSTYTVDPDLEKRNMTSYAVVYAQDPELSARIADKIRHRMSQPAPAHH
jgi:hypothetical protein